MDHEAFEILIEKRLHAAISAEESAALDAHLDACEACRRTLEESRTMDMVLKADGATIAARFSETEWAAIKERLVRRAKSGPRLVVLTMAAYAILDVLLNGERALNLVNGATLLALAAFFFALRFRARATVERASRGEHMAIAEEIQRQLRIDLGVALAYSAVTAALATTILLVPSLTGTSVALRLATAAVPALPAIACLALSITAARRLREFSGKAGG